MGIGAVIDICGVWVVIKIEHNQRTYTVAWLSIKLLKYISFDTAPLVKNVQFKRVAIAHFSLIELY